MEIIQLVIVLVSIVLKEHVVWQELVQMLLQIQVVVQACGKEQELCVQQQAVVRVVTWQYVQAM
jgi:hypothetical protein